MFSTRFQSAITVYVWCCCLPFISAIVNIQHDNICFKWNSILFETMQGLKRSRIINTSNSLWCPFVGTDCTVMSVNVYIMYEKRNTRKRERQRKIVESNQRKTILISKMIWVLSFKWSLFTNVERIHVAEDACEINGFENDETWRAHERKMERMPPEPIFLSCHSIATEWRRECSWISTKIHFWLEKLHKLMTHTEFE